MELLRDRKASFLAAVAVLALSVFPGVSVPVNAPGGSLPPAPSPAYDSGRQGGTPIRLDVEQLPPGEKITLGEFPMTAGTVCEALLTWEGGTRVTIECRPGSSYALESGKPTSFLISSDGFYSFPVCNRGTVAASSLQGTIRSYQDPDFVPESGGAPGNTTTATSFDFETLTGGAEQAAASYYLEAGDRLRLVARVDSGTVTALLLREDGTAAASCPLAGHSTGELTASKAGVYTLVFRNEGEEALWGAMGLVLRVEGP